MSGDELAYTDEIDAEIGFIHNPTKRMLQAARVDLILYSLSRIEDIIKETRNLLNQITEQETSI